MAYKVVFQLNEGASCQMEAALRNIRNLQAEIVPSGIGELVRRQAEGWAYVRP